MQKHILSIILRGCLILLGSSAFSIRAQTSPSGPVSLLSDRRSVSVESRLVFRPHFVREGGASGSPSAPFAAFDKTVSFSDGSPAGSTNSATASQISSVAPDHIIATGSLTALAAVGQDPNEVPSATGEATLAVSFQVSQPVPFNFAGFLTQFGGEGGNASGSVKLDSAASGEIFSANSAASQDRQFNLQFSGVLLPGKYTLSARQDLAVTQGQATADYRWDLQLENIPPPPNTPPFILWVAPGGSLSGVFPDITISKNTPIAPVPYSLFDFDHPVSQLVVSAHSSNPSLIPDSGLQLNGQTLTLTPVADQSGSAVITLTVSDGLLSSDASFKLTVTATAPPPGTFINSNPIVIPDQGPGTPYPSTIQVGGLEGVIQSVTVELDGLTHTWPRDIGVLLVGPGAQAALLMEQAGYGKPINNLTLTFDDSAADLLPEFDQIISGTYRPTLFNQYSFDAPAPRGPYDAKLSVFRGRVPNGVWSLYVFDDAPGDHGVLSGGWSLTIHTVPNTLPSISYIRPDGEPTAFPDQSTLANVTLGPIDLIASDQEQNTDQLTFSGHSSNSTLIPDSNIIFRAGTTATDTPAPSSIRRDVMLIPAPGETGAATITLTVSDGFTQTSASFNFEVASPAYQAQTFVNPSTIVIPDHGMASPYPSTIQVNGLSGAIANVSVRLFEFTHTSIHDVRLLLVSPTGASAMLMDRVSQYPNGLFNGIIGFDDAAAPMSALNPDGFYHPTIGFLPTRPVSNVPLPAPALAPPYRAELAVFRAIPPNGTWSLYVDDAAARDQGTIAGGWDLTITTTPSSPPTISPIPDQSLVINTVSAPIPFLVGDALTTPDDLVVSASSSNPVLLPDEHIVFGGSGPNRTVTLTPVAGQTGSATITISVTNRTQLGVSTSFALTVNPDGSVMTFVNSGTITIPAQGAAAPYPSTIQVSGLSGRISKVTATLYNFTHTWPHDVGVLLVSPSGEATLLLADVGGGNPARNVTLDFDDTAPASLTQQLIVPGTYRPTSFNANDLFPPDAPTGPYPASLSVFNGTTPNGTWSLYVADDAADDSGTIANGWSVTLYTTGDSPGLLSTRFSSKTGGTEGRTWAAPASASPASAWIESMTVWPDGQAHLIIRGQPGQGYTVQASSNATDWQDLFTTARPGAPLEFIDPHGREYPQRFYRVKVLEMAPASTR